jgi:predicted amidohydrolase
VPRPLTIAAAQLGPIARSESRDRVVARLLALLRQAKGRGAELVVFPELALTTFFPRWYLESQAEIDAYFETEMPGPITRPLFEAAAELGVAFYLGYAELTPEGRHFNSSILVDRSGRIAGRHRKVHLRAMPSTSRGGRSSTWRSAISNRATSAFRCTTPWAARSACASATTGAGRRPIASWACAGPS